MWLLPAPAMAGELPAPTIVERAGLRFGIIRPAAVTRPVPTLIFFATSIEHTFSATYGGVPRLAHEAGWAVVTLDLPAHGADVRDPERLPNAGLWAWRARLEAGENIVESFTRRLSALVTLLIASGEAESGRVFVGGISRGGFMALHGAAAEPRIAGIVALMPVTELGALLEFKGLAGAGRSDVAGVASGLAGRAVWVTIGTNDDRVDTTASLRLAQAVATAAARAGRRNRLELHVREAQAHTYPEDTEALAAAWLRALAAGSR